MIAAAAGSPRRSSARRSRTRPLLAVPLLLALATVALGLTGCDTQERSCDHRAFVKATALSGGFTGGEVTESAKWTTSGIGGPCVGNSTTNLRLDTIDDFSNRCYTNFLIDTSTHDRCWSYWVDNSPPYGAMSINNETIVSWLAPAGKYTKAGAFHLFTGIKVEHRSGNNKPTFTPGCFHWGIGYMQADYDCQWSEQY